MLVPMADILKHHGEKIWYLANRFRLGMWDDTDMFQELLLRLSQHQFMAVETPCLCGCGETLPWSGGHINRKLSSLAIDVRRKEGSDQRRGKKRFLRDDRPRQQSVWAAASNRDLARRILDVMTTAERQILELIANPDAETIARAEADQAQAREAAKQDGVLRMNVHNLKIFNKHVAQRLGVTNAAVSRALQSARQLLSDVQIHAEHVA